MVYPTDHSVLRYLHFLVCNIIKKREKMNKLQEKKLRKIIKNILISEGIFSADMFAALKDSPGGKELSKSQSTYNKNDDSIKQLISSLRAMRKDVLRIYGESGKNLIQMLDRLEPVRTTFVDEDPTRYMDQKYKIKMQ